MAMVLTASPQSALPSGPSWDETIVPSLRKRLETESRILTKRLSTISIDERPSQRPKGATSPSHDNVDSYPQRPSAIPRPSFSSRHPSSSPTDPARKSVPPKRKRTQSTPFPFENSASSVPNGDLSGVTSPAASTSSSTSPRLQSPRMTTSRIPTVSARTRSGSQSSQSIGTKASLPPSHKYTASEATPLDPVSLVQSLHGTPSSSSLVRQRIIDERPPFTNEPPPNVLEQEFTRRPSADEEHTFQHWYRGDMSRSGGVGEYRVGKRLEMLDIANYGHLLRGRQMRAYEEPIPRSPGVDITVGPRKRAESVSSRERASIYIDPQDDSVTVRVLDETPLTDIETDEPDHYDRNQHSHAHEYPIEFGMQRHLQQQYQEQQQPNGIVQTLPTNHNRGNFKPEAPATLPIRLLPTKPQAPQSRIPQAQARLPLYKGSTSGGATTTATTTSEPSTPAKSIQSRGRPQANTAVRAKPAAKVKPQKRSKSAGDALQSTSEKRESKDYAGLADAVPEMSSPKPQDGNWDEVILPTVARRMGIEYEKEIPALAANRKARESQVAPAPGTFGYDHSKYKPPRKDEDILMDEFGRQRPEPAPDFADDSETALPAMQTSPPAPTSILLRSKRETMPASPPFSQYLSPDTMPALTPEARRGLKEQQDPPHIIISPPTNDDRMPHVQDGEGAGCCKCVVM